MISSAFWSGTLGGCQVTARLVGLDPRLLGRSPSQGRGRRPAHRRRRRGTPRPTSAYVGAVPADVILVCGVFGNVTDADIHRTVAELPRLGRARCERYRTRHRPGPGYRHRHPGMVLRSGIRRRSRSTPRRRERRSASAPTGLSAPPSHSGWAAGCSPSSGTVPVPGSHKVSAARRAEGRRADRRRRDRGPAGRCDPLDEGADDGVEDEVAVDIRSERSVGDGLADPLGEVGAYGLLEVVEHAVTPLGLVQVGEQTRDRDRAPLGERTRRGCERSCAGGSRSKSPVPGTSSFAAAGKHGVMDDVRLGRPPPVQRRPADPARWAMSW